MRCSTFPAPWWRPTAVLLGFTLIFGAAGGCARSTLRAGEVPTSRPVEGVGRGFFEQQVEAFVVPPTGWKLDPPKVSDRHVHLVWLSPSGDTAYGVIYFKVPVYTFATEWFHNVAFGKFLEQMRADQGEAIVHDKRWDAQARRIAYDVEGGLYRINALLSVRGKSGWSVYAGRLRERAANAAELALAERSRDATRVGRAAGELDSPSASLSAASSGGGGG